MTTPHSSHLSFHVRTVGASARRALGNWLALSAVCASIAACSSTNLHSGDSSTGAGADPTANVELVGQMQMPTGAKIINERTLILGAGDAWVGRITMEVGKDTNNAYQFFMDQYPRQGWNLVTAARGANSLIVFTRGDRTATIEIRDGTLAVTPTVVLTVSPKNAGTPGQPTAR